jgi:hypothetical protein
MSYDDNFYSFSDAEDIHLDSHHGQFMLEKAACLDRERVNVKLLLYHANSTLCDVVKSVKKIEQAKRMWWFEEANYLRKYYPTSVGFYLSRESSCSCGPTRTCGHRYWYCTGSPVSRKKQEVIDL